MISKKPNAETTSESVGGSAGGFQFRALIESGRDIVAVLNYDGTFRYLSPSVERVAGYLPGELIGESLFDQIHPDDAPRQSEIFNAVVSGHGGPSASEPHTFRIRHKTGHWVFLEAVSTELPEGTDSPGILINARDVTERVQAVEAMREEANLERRLGQENEVIAEVGRIISSTFNIEDVFELFAAQVRRLIDFDMIAASMVDHTQLTTTIRYWSGPEEYGGKFVTTVPLSGSITGEVLASGQPVLVQGRSSETSGGEIRKRFVHLSNSHREGVRSWLGIPMVNRARVIGALLFFSSEPKAFSDLDIALASRVSNQIAGAIDNAGLFAGLKQAETELAGSVAERIEAASRNEVIAEIGRIISSTLNIEEVYEPFADQVRNLIDFDVLSICTVERGERSGRIAYRAGDQNVGKLAGAPVSMAGSLTGEVAKLKRTIIVQGKSERDLQEKYPDAIVTYRTGVRSWLCTPLVNRGEFLGSLLMTSKKENSFTERDSRLAQRVGNQIAGAIGGAGIFSSLKRTEAELAGSAAERIEAASQNEVIAEIGRIISSTLDIDEVYEPFAEQVRNLIDFDVLSICMVEQGDRFGRIAYRAGDQNVGKLAGAPVSMAGSLTGEVAKLKRTIIVQGKSERDLQEKYPDAIVTYRTGVRSWLCTPLVNRGEFLGSLLMTSKKENSFNERDADLAQRVTNQIAGAIGGAGIFSSLKRTEAELAGSAAERIEAASQNEVIAEIGRIISSTLDIDEVYEPFAEQVRKLINFDILSIGVAERDGQYGWIAHRAGDEVVDRTVGTRFPFEGSIAGEVARVKHTVIVQGFSEHELQNSFPSALASYRGGMRSWMCAPLINGGDFVGTLLMLSKEENAFTERDADLAQRVGNQIAGAIGGAGIFANLKRTEAELARSAAERIEAASQIEGIAEIGRIISSTLNIDEVYEPFADQVRKLIDFDVLSICAVERDAELGHITHRAGKVGVGHDVGALVPNEGSLTGEVAKVKRPIIVQGLPAQDLQERFPFTVVSYQANVRSWLCTPLINGGDFVGALLVLSSKENAFTERDADLAQRVGNQIAGAIGSAQLYADLKKAESDLAASHNANQMILETAHDAFVSIDDTGRVVAWNSQAEKTFGWPACEAMGLRLAELIIPERFAGHHEIGMKVFLATGEGPVVNQRIEMVAKHRDGHEFPVELTISPLKLGDRYQFNAFVRDITGRRESEEALRQSEERFRAVYNHAANGIGTRTLDGTIKDLNPAFLNMVGYTMEEIRELEPGVLYDTSYIELEKDMWERALQGEEIRPYEKVFIRKDGTKVYTDVRASLERDDDGNTFGIVAVITDITDRKRLEQEIAQNTATLEQANEELQQLDRMKDEFISTVSHELRTPLTSIKGSAELLLSYDYEDRESQMEFLRIIDRECDRLTRLINDVLDLSRLESRQMRWVWEELDLAEVVNAAAESTQALSMQKDLYIKVNLDPDLPCVLNDRDRLVQVVTNLLSNSIKFTQHGGMVMISARKIPDDELDGLGEKLEICVADTGIGIGFADYENIFQKFKQVGDPLSTKPQGTGLGLPICKEIVEHFGGEIWVKSTSGDGSSFYFTVPLFPREQIRQ